MCLHPVHMQMSPSLSLFPLYVTGMWVHACQGAHVEVREYLTVHLFLPRGFWELNLGYWACMASTFFTHRHLVGAFSQINWMNDLLNLCMQSL